MTSTALKTILETDYPVQQIVAQPCLPPNVRYRQHQPWTNWGGTAQCSPEFTFYPQYVEDLIQIVHFAQATERKIRVAGTGHSWSALVPTDEILVCIHRLNKVAVDLSDESHPRVVVQSGATVKEVNEVLEQYGYALPLNVVLESVRFGGLIATGSHGSGWNNPTLSDLVSSIEIITAAGELRKFETGIESDDVMNAVRLNLGLFGIIYRMTLNVQKTWNVRALNRRLPIEHVMEHLQEWVPAHDSMDLFWWPFCDQFWLVWGPLQSQERWSLWTLLALLIFTQASYFIAVLILPKGRPPSRRNWYDWALGTALFIYALGLIWAAQTIGIL